MACERTIVAVLAGGAGSRMGGDKPARDLAGAPMITWPLRAAGEAGLEALVVAKAATVLPALSVRVEIEPDEPQHPLAGIVRALVLASERGAEAIVAVGCDMPFVTGPLLAFLAAGSGELLTRTQDRLQPLPARIRTSALPALERALEARLPLRRALCDLEPHVLAEHELARFGSVALMCSSVNDPEQLARAQALLSSRAGSGG